MPYWLKIAGSLWNFLKNVIHYTDSLQVIKTFSFIFPRVSLDNFFFSFHFYHGSIEFLDRLLSSEPHCLFHFLRWTRQLEKTSLMRICYNMVKLFCISSLAPSIVWTKVFTWITLEQDVCHGCFHETERKTVLFHHSVMRFKIYPMTLFYLYPPFHFTSFYLNNFNLRFSVHIFLIPVFLICLLLHFPISFPAFLSPCLLSYC